MVMTEKGVHSHKFGTVQAVKKFWCGSPPTKCDICNKPFMNVFYDASVNGRWGNICTQCFSDYDCSLGTGRGQRYQKQADGRFLKTGG